MQAACEGGKIIINSLEKSGSRGSPPAEDRKIGAEKAIISGGYYIAKSG